MVIPLSDETKSRVLFREGEIWLTLEDFKSIAKLDSITRLFCSLFALLNGFYPLKLSVYTLGYCAKS